MRSFGALNKLVQMHVRIRQGQSLLRRKQERVCLQLWEDEIIFLVTDQRRPHVMPQLRWILTTSKLLSSLADSRFQADRGLLEAPD